MKQKASRHPGIKGSSSAARRVRGFSIVEMLVALTISATLLTATLQAFNAAWRGYKHTTESASTHVVSRIVVHRVLAMIRTGSQFGPAPADVLDTTQNPLTSTYMDFVTDADQQAGTNNITRIERRTVGTNQYELWYKHMGPTGTLLEEHPLLKSVAECAFVLQFDPGPRLVKATIDLSVNPNDDADMKIGVGNNTPTIRLVASAGPRQLQ
jgi:prepilin-type N-terminal cleavage/methylation domain-containing protein